jgi:hypothetical protein
MLMLGSCRQYGSHGGRWGADAKPLHNNVGPGPDEPLIGRQCRASITGSWQGFGFGMKRFVVTWLLLGNGWQAAG